MHRVPEVAVAAERAHIKKLKRTWDYLSRAVQIFGIVGQVIEPPPMPPKLHSLGKSVTFVQHDLSFIPARQEWRCRNCNASATT
eukprot:159160-Pyramimonas_sp.AAC.1